jgi:hypothetical protein
LKAATNVDESAPDPYSSTWVDLIGPEYAAVLRPYRKLIAAGAVAILVGLPAELFWMSRVGSAMRSIDILLGFAFVLPGLITLGIGLTLQARLSYKINRDLWAAKLPTPGISPDLRNKSRFLYWSRHFGVTPEQVQEAGRRAAAAARSGVREPSAPAVQELWDLASKKADDQGGTDAE